MTLEEISETYGPIAAGIAERIDDLIWASWIGALSLFAIALSIAYFTWTLKGLADS